MDDFSAFQKVHFFLVFFVHPTVVSVLLSRMRDLKKITFLLVYVTLGQISSSGSLQGVKCVLYKVLSVYCTSLQKLENTTF